MELYCLREISSYICENPQLTLLFSTSVVHLNVEEINSCYSHDLKSHAGGVSRAFCFEFKK